MRRTALALAAFFAATIAAGETLKTLNLSRPAEGLASLTIKAGVGDVQIEGGATGEVVVRVEVKSKGGFFFCGPRIPARSRSPPDRSPHRGRRTLPLARSGAPRRHPLVERWTLRVPAEFAASVKLGVGDVSVLDVGGDVKVEIGVGDVRVEGTYQSFGDVRAACGVGDASLRTPSGREQGDGFIGHTLHGSRPRNVRDPGQRRRRRREDPPPVKRPSPTLPPSRQASPTRPHSRQLPLDDSQ